jgi:hypothetical protein
MTWQARLKADPLPWLLEADDPAVRCLALRDLVGLDSADPEVAAVRTAAHRTGPIAAILAEMDPQGFWVRPGPGYSAKYRSTVWAVILLAQLGASAAEDERIAQASRYVLDHTLLPGGQFTTNGAPSGTVDCLQGNLCWALTALGCDDPRLERAYDWLARSQTGEGIAPRQEQSAAVRYYAYKCGPGFACGINDGRPCAWGAAKVLLALAAVPADRRTPAMQQATRRGVDFLFSVDPATAAWPGGNTGKPNASWWKLGFPVFYVTDVLQVVEALVALGYGGDPRLANALDWLLGKQDAQGRWPLEYDYAGKTWVDFGPKHAPNKWITLRTARVFKAMGEE